MPSEPCYTLNSWPYSPTPIAVLAQCTPVILTSTLFYKCAKHNLVSRLGTFLLSLPEMLFSPDISPSWLHLCLCSELNLQRLPPTTLNNLAIPSPLCPSLSIPLPYFGVQNLYHLHICIMNIHVFIVYLLYLDESTILYNFYYFISIITQPLDEYLEDSICKISIPEWIN